MSMNLKPVTGSRRSRVAMETFANRAKVHFHLNEFQDKSDVIDQFSYVYEGGSTNTADAIRVSHAHESGSCVVVGVMRSSRGHAQ